ncbi:putative DnaJ domain, Chaperone J-domain superfamily [Septoria linicola]|nr:putative DnaJ domain, Chaperone J-domain superfamily [Septoria linicola]
MAGEDSDLKEHALNSAHDFYELLGISPAAAETEIRRAYRKTALKYHPDKVGNDAAALEKFHLLQIAYDVLSDETVRQLYDNARRAREEKKERDQAYEGRRKNLKEELERREREGVAGLKRKREENQEEEAFQRELKRLAADGARRRKEREGMLRKEAQEEFERENEQAQPSTPSAATSSAPQEIDRTIKLRYLASAADAPSKDDLIKRWSRFGKIQDAVLTTKKTKVEGEKHKKEYTTALLVYESIVSAHSAVTDFPRYAKEDQDWELFENVNWAGGKEPDCIPKTKTPTAVPLASTPQKAPTTPGIDRIKAGAIDGGGGGGLRKVPSFGSFKGTPKAAGTPSQASTGGLSMEDATMIRLKNAERRRLAEKLRKEEEAEDATAQ